MTINETIAAVRPLDQQIMEKAKKRWDSIAKPLHSLGKMEDLIIQIAGITGKFNVDIHKKALVAMCADNGIVEEGVTQTGQEVTAIVADNFVRGTSTVCVMCQECGVDMKPVDIGMVTDALARRDLKVAYGTRNMAKGACHDKRTGRAGDLCRDRYGRRTERPGIPDTGYRRDGHW